MPDISQSAPILAYRLPRVHDPPPSSLHSSSQGSMISATTAKENQMKAKATSNLKIVQQEPIGESESKRWDNKRWNDAQGELKITAADARQRVKVLRDEVERY